MSTIKDSFENFLNGMEKDINEQRFCTYDEEYINSINTTPGDYGESGKAIIQLSRLDHKEQYVIFNIHEDTNPIKYVNTPRAFCEKNSLIVSKAGDVLVGFQIDHREPEDITFDLTCGGQLLCTHTMKNGSFVYALEDLFMIFLNGIYYSEFRLQFKNLPKHGINVVYAILETDLRSFIAEATYHSPNPPSIGMMFEVPNKKECWLHQEGYLAFYKKDSEWIKACDDAIKIRPMKKVSTKS